MTYTNAHALAVILGVAILVGGLLYTTKVLADMKATAERRDEAWRRWTRGDV